MSADRANARDADGKYVEKWARGLLLRPEGTTGPVTDEWKIKGLPGPWRGEVVMKTGAVIQVSTEVLHDSVIVAKAVDDSFDRYLHPWKYPDRPVWPEFVPVPQLRALRLAAQVHRDRIRDAWAVLRGRETIYDPEDEW